jgi:hypothetical protein
MSGEMFKTMTGVQMQHIPYKGRGLMMVDLMGGGSHELREPDLPIRPPRRQAEGAGGDQRSAPSSRPMCQLQDAGLAGFDISSWQAMFAPAGCRRHHERIYAEMVRAALARRHEAPAGLKPMPAACARKNWAR